jgi:hypothetical protein
MLETGRTTISHLSPSFSLAIVIARKSPLKENIQNYFS